MFFKEKPQTERPHVLQVAASIFGNVAKGAYYLVQVILSLR
ncbi:hypothetical protein ACS9SB_0020335 [Bacillus subtilis]